jgi:hypothetical protein
MPHPDILKVLDMTPAEWGKLPFHDDTRANLKARAIAILKGDEVPVNTSTKAIVIHEASAAAEASGNITRAGFETAMIQQAKMFSEAVEDLRQKHVDMIEHIRIMEDSRADFTHIVLERLKAVEEIVKGLTPPTA